MSEEDVLEGLRRGEAVHVCRDGRVVAFLHFLFVGQVDELLVLHCEVDLVNQFCIFNKVYGYGRRLMF